MSLRLTSGQAAIATDGRLWHRLLGAGEQAAIGALLILHPLYQLVVRD